MRKIVINEVLKEVTLSCLIGNEIVAYRCKSSSNAAILAKVNATVYGFIPLGETNSVPRFTANSFTKAVETAMVSREVYIFANVVELCKWVIDLKN